MKLARFSSAAILAVSLCAPLAGAAQSAPGEGFSEAMPYAAAADGQAATGAVDGMVFAEGTRAINEGRWQDAIAIFSQIVEKKTDHADGALYWKAYAENKLGKTSDALASCAALRSNYPKSSWIDDCGALEIEIGTRTGEPVHPNSEQSDDLKLLALNSLMQHDEASAREQIEQILNNEDASGILKEGALFILGKKSALLTFPEIARLSYVEGDVRVTRGKEIEKTTGATWEKAVADLALETGYNLVTGAGRAEIELEDASTLYLAPNSVLSFTDLHTTNGVPSTEVALLSGTATLHVQPYLPDETFLLRTPSDDNVAARYPGTSYIRVTSYVDATAIAPLGGGMLQLAGLPDQTAKGETLFYRGEKRIDSPAGFNAAMYSEWDKWVAERIARRAAAMNAVMKEAHLTSPLPGLAEMEGQGRFFDCAPYGTCWEPTAAEKLDEQADDSAPAAQPAFATAALELNHDPAKLARMSMEAAGGQAAAAGSQNTPEILEREEFFPCTPAGVRYSLVRDPATGRETVVDAKGSESALAYTWGVCHAGYWIHRRHHYAWVVGKRHHHEPVRWIKSGRTVAYVPIHPRDLTGKTPVNARYDVFAVSRRSGISIERVTLAPERPLELLDTPPKEFRSVYLRPLARAEEPRMEVHTIKDAFGSKMAIAGAGVPLTFDRKSQSFTMPVHMMRGNQMVTVTKPISPRAAGTRGATGSASRSSSTSGGSHGSGGSSSAGSSHSAGGSSSASSSGSSGGSHH